jgi:beta-lactam-binding protein with PASTA domain
MALRGSRVALTVSVQAPDFGGLSCSEARELGRKRGLPELKCQKGMPPDDRHLTGLVFAQSVPAGELLEAPELVLVTVAALTVPDVEGRTVLEAQHALQKLKLKAVLDVAGDMSRVVDDQAPDAGTMVNIGDAVRLTTARLVAVPDVNGRSCTEAEDVTTKVELKLMCREGGRGYSLLSPRVITQFPNPNALVQVGTVVQAQASAPTPWDTIGLAALLAAGSAAALRVWRPPRPGPHLRGEPDHSPIVAMRMERSAEPGLPAITVRGERGSAHVIIRGLDGGRGHSRERTPV